ncbi:type II toxin-antitoxin system YoeB family toxin [Thiothrix sp.]|uniref:Type II toxin-antitoxin system YoeB family toxin n=1 Tax=Candidatus Thiothrix anitrata TaxID=2823902 RepID=A0ABX7X0J2_9GAMM|nr:type II toxin-antitoxin system YoeB family toxin [Candidatus Thiothrix anitrata]
MLINSLIEDTKRSPFEGIGKPEPLRHNLAGF